MMQEPRQRRQPTLVTNVSDEQDEQANIKLEQILNLVKVYGLVVVQYMMYFISFVATYIIRPLFRGEKSVRKEIVLITGAGGYLGRKLTYEFARRGATLVLFDISEEANRRVYESVRPVADNDIHTFTVDISNEVELKKTTKLVKEKIGDVTMVIMAASPRCEPRSIMDLTYENGVEKHFKVGYMAQLWLIQAFLKRMVEKNHGHFVTISSSNAFYDYPLIADYSSIKLAQTKLLECVREELVSSGVTGVKTTLVFMSLITGGIATDFKDSYEFDVSPISGDKAAESIVSAVLKNKTVVFIPWYHRFVYSFKYLFDSSLLGVLVRKTTKINTDYLKLKLK